MNICVFVSVCLYICIRTVLCQMLYWYIFAFIFISICINIFVYLYLYISLSVSWYIFVRAECQCGPPAEAAAAAAAAAAAVRCSSDTFSGPGQAGFPPPFLFLLFVLFSVYCFACTVSWILLFESCFLPTVSYCFLLLSSKEQPFLFILSLLFFSCLSYVVFSNPCKFENLWFLLMILLPVRNQCET